jgi:hypothetical protein
MVRRLKCLSIGALHLLNVTKQFFASGFFNSLLPNSIFWRLGAMIQIDARSGFWTIKHLTCGAIFQITGDNILNAEHGLNCSNCNIPLNIAKLKDAVIQLIHCHESIERSSERHNDPSSQTWQIEPPIQIIEEEKTSIIRVN